MTTIKIQNLSKFIEILECITSYVDGCKLEISGQETAIYIKTSISRVVVTTSLCKINREVTNEKCEIVVDKLSKLICLLRTYLSKEQLETIVIEFDGSKIKYSGSLFSFALLTSKEEILSNIIDKPIQSTLVPICSFEVLTSTISEILSLSSAIFDNSVLKFALSQDQLKTKMIYIQMVSLNSSLSNNIRLHIANILSGNFDNQIFIDSNRLLLAKYTKVEKIKFSITNNNVLIMEADKGETSKFIIYTSLLKDQ